MTDLTQDEFTVLLLADAGESMIPIGRWKEPILALANRGLLQQNDEVNYAITLAGRQARAARDQEDESGLVALLESHNKMANARTQAQQSIEQAAQCLAAAAKASAIATGDAPTHALREWSKVALTRALELLNG
jgi:hypothetical protein